MLSKNKSSIPLLVALLFAAHAVSQSCTTVTEKVSSGCKTTSSGICHTTTNHCEFFSVLTVPCGCPTRVATTTMSVSCPIGLCPSSRCPTQYGTHIVCTSELPAPTTTTSTYPTSCPYITTTGNGVCTSRTATCRSRTTTGGFPSCTYTSSLTIPCGCPTILATVTKPLLCSTSSCGQAPPCRTSISTYTQTDCPTSTTISGTTLNTDLSTTSTTPQSTSSTVGTGLYIEKWGQCGGIYWVSPGTFDCAPGSTCVYMNTWYSQCL